MNRYNVLLTRGPYCHPQGILDVAHMFSIVHCQMGHELNCG